VASDYISNNFERILDSFLFVGIRISLKITRSRTWYSSNENAWRKSFSKPSSTQIKCVDGSHFQNLHL